MVGFPVMYWAAVQFGMNAEALFREVSSAATPEVRRLMIDWISEPERQSPEDVGWRLVETADGSRYKLQW